MYNPNREHIAIVGYGCVFPNAMNPNELWEKIINSESSVKHISKERWGSDYFLKLGKSDSEYINSDLGAMVDDLKLKKIVNKNLHLNKLDFGRDAIMLFESFRQAQDMIKINSLNNAKVSFFLGSMQLDENYTLYESAMSLKNYVQAQEISYSEKRRLIDEIDQQTPFLFFGNNNLKDMRFMTSIKDFLEEKYGFKSIFSIVDAACASSISAIDLSIQSLLNNDLDYAIAGGMDSVLSEGSNIIFSNVNALADKCSYPLDYKSDGMVQGEGASIIIMQKLNDAISQGNEIHGIISSIGCSSDGNVSSLFAPTKNGQLLAYSRAYSCLDNDVDYIEAHSTGTPVGDKTEISSLDEFFNNEGNNKRQIPVGSIKYLIGHTKAAAGCASLIKLLLMIKNRKIPPSKYFTKFPLRTENIYVNKEFISFEKKNYPLKFGLSSFGFGNINYHLVLEEYFEGKKNNPFFLPHDNDICLIAQNKIRDLDNIEDELAKRNLKIPPQSIKNTDLVQLKALISVYDCFKENNINPDYLNKDDVSVISASIMHLDYLRFLSERVSLRKVLDTSHIKKEVKIPIESYESVYPPISQYSGPGILNNVIAAKVSNYFDFRGPNFNIDAGLCSFYYALYSTKLILNKMGGAVILLCSQDRIDDLKVQRNGFHSLLFSTKEFAKKNMLKINAKINVGDFFE